MYSAGNELCPVVEVGSCGGECPLHFLCLLGSLMQISKGHPLPKIHDEISRINTQANED